MAKSKAPAYQANNEPLLLSENFPAQPDNRDLEKRNHGSDDWQVGMWDCFKGGDALWAKSCFCPCFVYGKTEARRRDATLSGYKPFNNDCAIWCGAQCWGFGWVLTLLQRGDMKKKYSIRGGDLMDVVVTACCTCCSIVQQEKEVVKRQQMGGYAAPAGMIAQPN